MNDREPGAQTPLPEPQLPGAPAPELPFSTWWPVFAGAFVGVGLRLLFGLGISPMTSSFILLAPLLVGAITVHVAERSRRKTWWYYAVAGAMANLFFVLGTLAILIEGWICALLIIPLMMIQGALGGLLMGAVYRFSGRPGRAMYSLAVLPLVLGAIEQELPLPERVREIERRIVIQAPPERVWQQIHHATDIRPEEVERGWAYRIGVPEPIAGVTVRTPEGLVRRITMGKGIHFDQVVVDWQENRFVRWTYRFDADSVPAGALDDHVRIGGKHFDLEDTSYTLTPKGNGTELVIRIRCRVSTNFNWYAEPIAQALLGNFGDVILDFYRVRSEARR